MDKGCLPDCQARNGCPNECVHENSAHIFEEVFALEGVAGIEDDRGQEHIEKDLRTEWSLVLEEVHPLAVVPLRVHVAVDERVVAVLADV